MPIKPAVFPRLYKRTKRGSIAWYQIQVLFTRGNAQIITDKASTIDGKSQNDIETLIEGKNIGKANETSMYQQANSEAQSRYNRLLDDGYKTEMPTDDEEFNTDQNGAVKPMLAAVFDEDKHTDFPYYTQPKLDGVRSIAKWGESKVLLTTRKGKPMNVPHIQEALEKILPKDIIFDGEMYVHQVLSFQEIVSATKKVSALTSELRYCVYDIVAPKNTFAERFRLLKHIADAFEGHPIELVRTQKVETMDDLNRVEEACVKNSYEGIMVRRLKGLYTPGFRSKDLLKLKRFEDAEFEITDVVEASGRDAGTAIFTCITKEGNEFNCRPQGTFEERADYWENRKKLIGKKLTIKFQGKSDDGIPRFPVGKAIYNP